MTHVALVTILVTLGGIGCCWEPSIPWRILLILPAVLVTLGFFLGKGRSHTRLRVVRLHLIAVGVAAMFA